MTATIQEHMLQHAQDLARQVWPDKPSVRPAGDLYWHCARVIGQSDQHALTWLEEFKIETYYPQLRQMQLVPRRELTKKQRADGVKLVKPRNVAFLPRYIFVRMNPDRADARIIFERAGIGGMVSADDFPIKIPPVLIEGLRCREVDGAIPSETKARALFDLGEVLRIKDGPFRDFTGVIEQLPDITAEELNMRTRLTLAVFIFGQTTPVSLELGQVEKI